MSYIKVLSEGARRARKPHQCFDCYRTIEPGTEYAFQTCVGGNVYTVRQHLDCRDLANEYRIDAGLDVYGYDDGFPPLKDDWSDSGEFQNLCDQYRGHFPHAITRMEFGEQMAEIRMADRLRAHLDATRLAP